jgi:hypothetical protein
MNGAHFQTDNAVAPGFQTKKIVKKEDKSNASDRDLFSVGMVVTIRHSPNDNNAMEIEYEPNLEGPIELKIPDASIIVVLGQKVILDNAAFFASLGEGNVVEVSGFVDNTGRIRATYAVVNQLSPVAGDMYEVKGFITGLNDAANTFQLGPLPDGSGITVTVSYSPGAIHPSLPSGPANGMHVQVMTADTQPVSGIITATNVQLFVARTDFPEDAIADLDGLVTKLRSGSGSILSFDLEGKEVRTDGSRSFPGHGNGYPTQREVASPGQGIRRVLLASKIIFRYRFAYLCIRRKQRIITEEGKMKTAVATFRNVACLPALLALSVVLAACGGGGPVRILPVPLRAAHRSAFPRRCPQLPARHNLRYFDGKPERDRNPGDDDLRPCLGDGDNARPAPYGRPGVPGPEWGA